MLWRASLVSCFRGGQWVTVGPCAGQLFEGLGVLCFRVASCVSV